MNEKTPQLLEDLKWMNPPGQEPASTALWIWVAVATLLLLIALVIFIRYRRGKGVPFVVAALPHVSAMKSLDDLDAMVQEGNERAFTQAVSDIVRTYIQDRFGLRAPHRSTEEFLFEASSSGHLSDPDQDLLGDFLVQCDQVKFAQQSMVVDNMRAMLNSARQFINGTMADEKKPEPASPKALARTGL